MRALVPLVALVMGALPLSPGWADSPSPCTVDIGRPAHGPAAIEALGNDLPAAARASGLTAKRLEHSLRQDRTMWVDQCGQAFYAEPLPAQAADESTPAPTSQDAFNLHSRPGAARTMYLDFTGETLSGTAWNTAYTSGQAFTAEPYSKDADPTFSQSERDTIVQVWQRVAEDYAPFTIDVTTQEPDPAAITRSAPSDDAYGTRVLITPTSTVYSSCSCGGIAYVGLFDTTYRHSYYQPALVFTRGVGTGSKGIAEAASHEAGHTLGLGHDGTTSASYYGGQGAWAPIMGVGYYRPLTQWSKGEYANPTNTQDDLAIMAGHGATPMTDDAGNSAATATRIDPGDVDGLIGTPSDTDWCRFTATGPTSLSAQPSALSPDLDIAMTLYDSDGNVVAASDPAVSVLSADLAGGLNASLRTELPPGQYAVAIDGTGYGSPTSSGYSDYGSLGPYRLRLSTSTPLLIDRPQALPADVGQPYTLALTASGGTTPYTWAIIAGSLPPGLALAADGRLAGTPTQAGQFSATVQLRDAAGFTTAATLAILVRGPEQSASSPTSGTTTARTSPSQSTTTSGGAQSLRILTNRLPVAHKGVRYRTHLRVSTAGRWTRMSGTLPKGVHLTRSGGLRGTPKKRGEYAFVASVRAGALRTQRAFLLVVRS